MTKLIETYLLWLRSCHTPATVESYKWALRPFHKWVDENAFIIGKLTIDDISDFFFSLEQRGLKEGTRHHYALALRSFWNWLYKRGETALRPEDIPSPPRDNIEPHPFIDLHEYERLLASFNEFFPKDLRNKTIIAVFFTTGLRLGELMSLNIGDVDLNEKFAEVKTFKRKNHRRAVYFPDYVNDLLKKWVEVREILLETKKIDTDALFITTDTRSFGARIKRHVVQRLFRTSRRNLGIEKKITPHSCRHGFATYAMQKNINLRNLQELMGHSSIRTTSRYLGVRRADVEQDYRKIFEVVTVGESPKQNYLSNDFNYHNR